MYNIWNNFTVLKGAAFIRIVRVGYKVCRTAETRKLEKPIDRPIPRNCPSATMASHPLTRSLSFVSGGRFRPPENSPSSVNFS